MQEVGRLHCYSRHFSLALWFNSCIGRIAYFQTFERHKSFKILAFDRQKCNSADYFVHQSPISCPDFVTFSFVSYLFKLV